MNETSAQTMDKSSEAPTRFKPLRIWPIFPLMVVMVVAPFTTRLVEDGSIMLFMIAMMAPALMGLAIACWWLAFSRATLTERIAGCVGIVLLAALAIGLADKSMLGPAVIMITIPMGTAAFAIGAILFHQNLTFKRTLVAILFATVGFGFTLLLRSTGVWGNASVDWNWRWVPSAEENMLAERDSLPTVSMSELKESEIDKWLANPEWPRFRGLDGLSKQRGPKIDADWTGNPPEEIWRIAVGPGWSSFAVAGNLLFTQEQHGENEAIVCYAADSGKEIWAEQIKSRFDDPMGGPGPRATPTLANGALFVQGANGQLLKLDPKSGTVLWEKDLREIASRQPPTWGFSSSPLVVGSVVIAYAGGADDKGILAFDIETGELIWSAASGDHSYSSPQLCSIGEDEYVLMLTNTGLNMLDPQTGEPQLNYEWEISGYRALQPQVVDGNSILLPTGPDDGTRRIRITKSEAGLTAEETWTAKQLRPDFNDFVVYGDHAYGFDGAIFTCVDLDTGERKWKRGRYGKGQVLLLENSGTLLVASENGDAILVKADPAEHQELAKIRALEGRTWNHPVVIGDQLYIRNAKEAACYRLPLVAESVSKPITDLATGNDQ